MELFEDDHHVRLRSRQHGTYLCANEDGHGVSLHHRRRRASMNAAWVVHLLPHQNQQYMFLCNAAYGGYLAATEAPAPFAHGGLRVEQRNYDHPDVVAVVWSAIPVPAAGDHPVVLWNMTRGFLRAYVKNGIRHLNNGVSVAGINDDIVHIAARMSHWIVEPIPDREGMPPLPPPTIGLRLRQLPFRLIHFVWPGEGVDVHAPLIDHGFFLFFGRSVFRLRIELARRLDVDIANLVMCLRTGANLLTPLLVDLPTNHDTLHIVVVIAGTPAHEELRYPDVDAE
ncbi:hypothetical protein ZWY2020_049433 [Hordeum vulgare]|nr:hypothetical protein ZWY2020_049433 [Hordeum vulgare]